MTHQTADAVRKIAQSDRLSVRDHKMLMMAAELIEVQAGLLKGRQTTADDLEHFEAWVRAGKPVGPL
jgi:hypothetical protein